MSKPTFVSVYSGAGGFDTGFILAGFRPVFATDVDADAVATYDANSRRMSETLDNVDADHEATCGDIQTVKRNLAKLDNVDVVIGGPPCQGFSVAGRMDPTDPRSAHVWEFMNVVKQVQPRAFVMENVKALATNQRWEQLLERLRLAAEAIGYSTKVYVLNAAHFGVPQTRERMFLVGLAPGFAHHQPLASVQARPKTVRDALSELPKWCEPGNDTTCRAKITPAKRPVIRRSPYAGMLFNGKGRPLDLDEPAPTVHASMGGNATPIIDQREFETDEECWVIGYHAHLSKGKRPLRAVPDYLRRITVEEAAALQGFGAETTFSGSLNSMFRQVGNAVPPPLGASIAEAVARSIGRGPTTNTELSTTKSPAN